MESNLMHSLSCNSSVDITILYKKKQKQKLQFQINRINRIICENVNGAGAIRVE